MKVAAEIPNELARQIDRIIRDGWFPDHESVVREALSQFVDRALSLLSGQKMTDFTLYQSLVELRVQILLVLGREADALASLEEARQQMPNNPSIAKWIEKLGRVKT